MKVHVKLNFQLSSCRSSCQQPVNETALVTVDSCVNRISQFKYFVKSALETCYGKIKYYQQYTKGWKLFEINFRWQQRIHATRLELNGSRRQSISAHSILVTEDKSLNSIPFLLSFIEYCTPKIINSFNGNFVLWTWHIQTKGPVVLLTIILKF